MTRKANCNEELLTLYHYHELTAPETEALEQHLAECLSCRTGLAELRAGLAALPQSQLQISSAHKQQFVAQVMARVQPKRSGLLRWRTVLAAGVTLGLLVLLVRPLHQPLPSPVVSAPSAGAALADIEVLDQLELLKELDLLQDLELLEELG